ncbi:MAG: hypothetical protein KI791_23175 [Cyclobacteriaceae bacterium]|nr:hypothetical protein [Cyclobacteriaceae bacterium SS2]
MIIAFNILIILLICWWISRFSQPYEKIWYWVTLGLKACSGLILGIIYIIYLKSGDTLSYFQQAQDIAALGNQSYAEYFNRLLTNEFPEYKGEYRSEFFARMLSFFLVITGGNYWISSVYLSLISFLGSWSLTRTLALTDEKLKWPALIGFMLVPSVIFWSSGILKDTVANACFFYLCTFLIRFYFKTSTSFAEHLFYAITLIILLKLRFYLGGAILFFIGLFLIRNMINRFISIGSLKYLIYLMTITALIFGVSFIDYNLQFNHFPNSIYQNYQSILESSGGSNIISFNISPDWWSIIRNLPKSLFYGLFGPFPGQGSDSSAVYWIENLIMMGMFALNIYVISNQKLFQIKNKMLLYATLGFLLIMAMLLPIAAPNFGTLMRYKSAFLPFWWMLLLYYPFVLFRSKKSA